MKSVRILLTGKNGQVGFELQRALAPLGDVTAVGQAECNFCDPNSIRDLISRVQPDIIVNPAAFTAVDKAESEPIIAEQINSIAPRIIGEEASKIGALVVHYSTDYVFDGSGSEPFSENDLTNPLSVYGKTKLAGEKALAECCEKHLIFRTSWVFGAHGANFAKTMLRLAGEREQLSVVSDQFGAPTSAALIADVTAQIIGEYIRHIGTVFPYGCYHLVADGVTNWHEYACYVIRAAELKGNIGKIRSTDVAAIQTKDYPVPAPRPKNSRLCTSKLKATFGLSLPSWQKGLDHVLQQIL